MKSHQHIQPGQTKSNMTIQGASLSPPTYGLSFVDHSTTVQKKENKTGMPDQLKSGIESLSGIDISDVKVHYNSSQPAQLNAHAYAQGNQIHIAPGQQKYLPHEAWHVVQQKQGRVQPTRQLKGRVNINDDHKLELEADRMGAMSLSHQFKPTFNQAIAPIYDGQLQHVAQQLIRPVQRAGIEDQAEVPHFLLDSSQKVAGGEMHKIAFLDQLNARLTQLADVELAKIHQTTRNCPYLAYWISYYKKLPAHTIERGIRLYTSDALNTTNAHEVLSRVSQKVLAALRTQLAKSPLYPVIKSNPDKLSAPGGIDGQLLPPKITPTPSDTAQLGSGASVFSGRDVKSNASPLAAGQSASGAAAAPAVTYPADSIGDATRVMAQRKYAGEERVDNLTGAQLQQEIIELAKKAEQQETGGYRLGTFLFDPSPAFTRINDPKKEEHGMRMLPNGFNVGTIDPLIIPLVRGTLEDAGQLAYLTKNWHSISQTHIVVVDVDCQFNRSQQQLGFHKDSRGTTVFFNLTYSNAEPMQGPDFYQDHHGASDLEEQLPESVRADIAKRRETEKKGGNTDIHSPRLGKFARVSLSDPNLYHSTPKLGHRISSTPFDREATIARLVQIYLPNNRDLDLTAFFKTKTEEELRQYAVPVEQYNMHKTESKALAGQEEALRDAAAKRKRRLSVDLNEHNISQEALTSESKIPRTFIRTWIRMVPKPQQQSAAAPAAHATGSGTLSTPNREADK